MNSNFKFNSLLLLIIILVYPQAGNSQSGGFQLLGIGPDPVTLSLSEAITARSTPGSAIFMNPANNAHINRLTASASHTFWLETSGNTFFSVHTPSRYGVISIGVLTSAIDDIEARQVPGTPSGNFEVSYYAFAGSYSKQVGPLAFGVTAMYLYEELYNLWATGYAVSGGVSASFLDNRLRIGSSLLNNGEMEILVDSRSPLPTMWRTGIWSRVLQVSTVGSSEIPLTVALSTDLTVPLNEDGSSDGATSITDPWISAGLEIVVSDLISIRTGIRTGETKRRFSAGLGIEQGSFRFDYAYIPFETGFGVTHSLGITYRL
jgi:hypothetical protein